MKIKTVLSAAAAFAFALLSPSGAKCAGECASPESQGVSSQAILDWIDACEKDFDALHGFVIRRHGKIIAEGSWKPFKTLEEPHMLYSHSKSFISTAIGLLVDEGKLDLDERVVSLFPYDLPERKSARLMSLRVRDLLTMNMGAKDHLLRDEGDWAKKALAKELCVDPGTRFKYDSDATYLLSAIVQKKSKMKTMDYLSEKLFKPLGFGKVWSTLSPQGIACGGWGMQMSTRDISKLGQLYLDEGVWNGRRILSRDWVRLATSKQTASGWGDVHDPASDWCQGYGFQFWRCRHNAYRADGADGQYTIVMPDQDAVVSIHASLGDMAKELNHVWKYLLPAMKKGALPENCALSGKLAKRCASLKLKTPAGKADGVEKFLGRYVFAKNPRGFKSVTFSREKGALMCTLQARAGKWKVPVGIGEWKRGTLKIDPEEFEGLGYTIGRQTVASALAVGPDGALRFRSHFINCTLKLDFTVTIKDSTAVLKGVLHGMRGTTLAAKRSNPEKKPAK